jgi:hypothetical protein
MQFKCIFSFRLLFFATFSSPPRSSQIINIYLGSTRQHRTGQHERIEKSMFNWRGIMEIKYSANDYLVLTTVLRI